MSARTMLDELVRLQAMPRSDDLVLGMYADSFIPEIAAWVAELEHERDEARAAFDEERREYRSLAEWRGRTEAQRDRLAAALREIEALAVSHRAGSIGQAQQIVRAALDSLENP